MKTKIFTTLLLLQVFKTETSPAQTDGGCGCHSNVVIYNYGAVNYWVDLYISLNVSNVSAYINPGDSIRFNVSSIHECYTSMTLTSNGDTLFNGSTESGFTVYDTGYYHYRSVCDIWGFKDLDLHISYYNGTAVIEESSIQALQLYPTRSDGIYHLNSGEKIKQIIFSDSAGRNVFDIHHNFSEINLTKFSSGIYYYAIIDEKENVFRGRIVKD